MCEELKTDLKERFAASDERHINWNDSTINITSQVSRINKSHAAHDATVIPPFFEEPIDVPINLGNETIAEVARKRRAIVFSLTLQYSFCMEGDKLLLTEQTGAATVIAITEHEDYNIYNVDLVTDPRKKDDNLFELKLDMKKLDKIDRLVIKRGEPGQLCISNLLLTSPTGRRYELTNEYEQSAHRPNEETSIIWFDQPCSRDDLGMDKKKIDWGYLTSCRSSAVWFLNVFYSEWSPWASCQLATQNRTRSCQRNMQFHYEYGATPAERIQTVTAPREACESQGLIEFHQDQSCQVNVTCPNITNTMNVIKNVTNTTNIAPTLSQPTPPAVVATRELGIGVVENNF